MKFESWIQKIFFISRNLIQQSFLFCPGHYSLLQKLQTRLNSTKFLISPTNSSKNHFFRPKRKKNACLSKMESLLWKSLLHLLLLDSSSRYVVWYEHCINYSSLKSFFCCFAAFHLKFIRRIFHISLSFVPHWERKQAKLFAFTCFFGSSFMVITPQNHTDKRIFVKFL